MEIKFEVKTFHLINCHVYRTEHELGQRADFFHSSLPNAYVTCLSIPPKAVQNYTNVSLCHKELRRPCRLGVKGFSEWSYGFLSEPVAVYIYI